MCVFAARQIYKEIHTRFQFETQHNIPTTHNPKFNHIYFKSEHSIHITLFPSYHIGHITLCQSQSVNPTTPFLRAKTRTRFNIFRLLVISPSSEPKLSPALENGRNRPNLLTPIQTLFFILPARLLCHTFVRVLRR